MFLIFMIYVFQLTDKIHDLNFEFEFVKDSDRWCTS